MKAVTLKHLRSMCDEVGDCWLWKGRTHHAGTPRFCVDGRDRSVYRLAYCLHHGKTLDEIKGLWVWPTTERGDINPANLTIGTLADLRRWEKANGRAFRDPAARVGLTKGARSRHNTRLSVEIAREIRASDETSEALGQRFGVSANAVRDVRNGRTWREGVGAASVFSMGRFTA